MLLSINLLEIEKKIKYLLIIESTSKSNLEPHSKSGSRPSLNKTILATQSSIKR